VAVHNNLIIINAEPGELSPGNLGRMREGQPPVHPDYHVLKELHHHIPQREGGTHHPNNLMEVGPREHDRIDPYRHYRGPKP